MISLQKLFDPSLLLHTDTEDKPGQCSQDLKDSPRRCLVCLLRVRDRSVWRLHMHIGIGSRYAQKSVEVTKVCVECTVQERMLKHSG